MMLLLLIVGVFAVLAIVLGRGLFYTQQVSLFASTIDEKSPAEVKAEVSRFARGLGDVNPLVRNASIAAMRLATGKDLGANAAAWIVWWRENEATWEYQPAPSEPVQ
jgi:hypothetical protein